MSVLVIDNYDSFTYNLVQYLGELGVAIDVVRNDQASAEALVAAQPTHVVISPGPGTPSDAGVTLAAVNAFAASQTPLLGVCLGHQAIGQAFGGKVVRHTPIHGKNAAIEHDGGTIFVGLPSPLTVGRYHSLVVERDTLPECLEVSASYEDVVMAVRHRELPIEGVQFHPESILTDHGKQILKNFLDT